jgi:hypothetical protein
MSERNCNTCAFRVGERGCGLKESCGGYARWVPMAPVTVQKPAGGANARQVGGSHYQKAIQPWDYIAANGIGYFEGNVIKYVSRWRDKAGIEDLKKARHYLDKLIELEGAK